MTLLSPKEKELYNETEDKTELKEDKENVHAEDEMKASVTESRNCILDAIMSVFSYLPDSAGKIYSNFGENWIDFKANLEGNCISSRHCILSGEKKIQLLIGAVKLQKILSYFDAVITASKSKSKSNLETDPSSLKKEKGESSTRSAQNSWNLRARVLSMAVCCVRVVPLAAVTVRTCLFFGAVNQR